MTPTQRHAELTRLRVTWTEAVYLAGVARPGTSEWRMARLDERRAGAEYLRVLAAPYQPGSQGDADATPTEAESAPDMHSLRQALAVSAKSRPLRLVPTAHGRESRRRSPSRGRVRTH